MIAPTTLYSIVSKLPGVGIVGVWNTLGEAQIALRGIANAVIVPVSSR